jgi:surface-anchored protein
MRHSPLHGLGRTTQPASRVARPIRAQGILAKSIMLLGVATLALTNAARAADLPVLTSGHTDVGVNYEDGAWDLHVHAEELGMEYEPDAVWLQVGSEALTQVPTNAAFSFLGEAGAPLWVLPAVENHDLLFLGFGTEELALGIFSNDTVTLTLKSVTGPGDFILYTLDMFGNPVMSMNSRDGIDSSDTRTLTAGGHVHVNWVFTAPGQYHIGLQASGVLAATGETNTSDVAEYLFDVQYAPILAVTRKDAATLTLQWLSREHHEYHLESTTDLVGGEWAAHPGMDPVGGTGQYLTLDVPVEPGPRFFRLEIHEEDPHHHPE